MKDVLRALSLDTIVTTYWRVSCNRTFISLSSKVGVYSFKKCTGIWHKSSWNYDPAGYRKVCQGINWACPISCGYWRWFLAPALGLYPPIIYTLIYNLRAHDC